ncbi:MAG: Gldg family protein [Alphaproteobacteria bacterium]|nr:Gldg family protein [Alphaproteobacteria bacterium]
MTRPLSRRVYAITALILAAIIFVAINIGSDASLTTEQIDLTQNGLYTISKGTKEILRSLKEPITLKFYYSKKSAADYAQISAYATRVRDLLQRYATLSNGKVIVEELDPAPYTRAEDEANAAGLTGAQTDNGHIVYFGLVGTNTIDGTQTIPFFSLKREPFLEYDITSLIYRLSQPTKPVIGVLSSLPLDVGAGGMMAALQGRAQPYVAWQQLTQNYKTRMIPADFKTLPRNIAVLMIVQPNKLNAVQQYAIDQYVLRGGHVLVFVDPRSDLAVASGGGGQPVAPASSDLPKLFKAWGIGFNPHKIIADGQLAQQVEVQDNPHNPIVLYPTWLRIGKAQMNRKDQVTANLSDLNLATVGALFPAKGATTHFTPLITSSDDASLIATSRVQLTPPQDLLSAIHPMGKPFVIAARISGPARTAFPDGAPPGAPAKGEIKSAKTINLIVMADTDIFDDHFWVRMDESYGGKPIAEPFADNGAFILNAVENLTGSNALISLRTRSVSERPFTVVKELQAEAQAEFQQQANDLQQKLADTEHKLKTLEGGGDASSGTVVQLSSKQQNEIEAFKRELIDTRLQLRRVQLNLRKSVDQLGSILAFLNIAFVPILVALFAIVLAWLRRRRRARAVSL